MEPETPSLWDTMSQNEVKGVAFNLFLNKFAIHICYNVKNKNQISIHS